MIKNARTFASISDSEWTIEFGIQFLKVEKKERERILFFSNSKINIRNIFFPLSILRFQLTSLRGRKKSFFLDLGLGICIRKLWTTATERESRL